MEFKDVVKKRRSTRRYTGQPVEKEKLQRAMELQLNHITVMNLLIQLLLN